VTALRALGIATPSWVADYFRTGSRPHVRKKEAAAELAQLAVQGLAIPVEVSGLAEPAWLDPTQVPRLEALRDGKGRPTLTTLLSPFDSLVWTRARGSALFGFDYRIEVYTPAPKRRYGYYTLPILHRGRLVGRLDPSYSRKERVLTIKAVHLEPGVRVSEALAAAIAWSLRDYASFLGGKEIRVLVSDPPMLAPAVRSALANDS